MEVLRLQVGRGNPASGTGNHTTESGPGMEMRRDPMHSGEPLEETEEVAGVREGGMEEMERGSEEVEGGLERMLAESSIQQEKRRPPIQVRNYYVYTNT